MNFFEAHGIHKVYGTTHALTDVTISVPEGSIFGLLGPNGAGKTTLIRIINQITAPDKGEVILSGKKMTRDDISRIGYLPEERGLYTKMKIGEQALYLAKLKGMTHQEAMTSLKYWFKKFDIVTWWDKKVEELSKGMQQKVQFITTVVHNPKLLIFDEPFSGFDPINANLIKKEILELRNNGATIIFSTHNMATVEDLCHHIALINKSRKILDGPVYDIKESYKSNIFEVFYKGEFDKVESALGDAFRVISHEESHYENSVRIQGTDGHEKNNLIATLLGVAEIRSFKEVVPSMNDVFIKAVEKYNAEIQKP